METQLFFIKRVCIWKQLYSVNDHHSKIAWCVKMTASMQCWYQCSHNNPLQYCVSFSQFVSWAKFRRFFSCLPTYCFFFCFIFFCHISDCLFYQFILILNCGIITRKKVQNYFLKLDINYFALEIRNVWLLWYSQLK